MRDDLEEQGRKRDSRNEDETDLNSDWFDAMVDVK